MTVVRLVRERAGAGLVDLLRERQRDHEDVVARVLECTVVPPAALAEARSGGVDRERRHDDDVRVREGRGTERLAAGLRRAPGGTLLEIVRENARLIVPAEGGRVSTSIGLAGFESGAAADEMLHRADQAMYAAKQSGKDRVAEYERLQTA